MTAYEIISKKRDGLELSIDEIRFMVDGYSAGDIPDYQMSALLMAIFLQDMNDREIHALTDIMLHSGDVLNLSEIDGIKVDKHSTGGVGDKVSIILAPIVAAAGVPVPMISGRGLGHTGGTLDKLESIPGFRVDLPVSAFREQISRIGVCLIGQTPGLAPADKKMYALRDVTATVQSIPLITASIMSKKLAEGIDALVLDVKTGRGAFMQTHERSEQLARQLIRIGQRFGKPTVAYITNMEQPLGNTVGNWLEIEECIAALQGKGPEDLMQVTHRLSGAMLHLGGKAATIDQGVEMSKRMISSGKAWDKFLQIVEAQGGRADVLLHPGKYEQPGFKQDITAPEDAFLASIDALETGLSAVVLGAGRQKSEDPVDPKAGIRLHKKAGDRVEKGQKVMTVYSDRKDQIPAAVRRLQKAITYSNIAPPAENYILKYMDEKSMDQ